MAYHTNIAQFGRYGDLRDSPFGPGAGDPISFPSRRIASPQKDQLSQKHPETAFSERPEFSDAWSFYSKSNRLSLSPLSYDQYSHPPPHLMPRPIAQQLAQAPTSSAWEMPVPTHNDNRAPKSLIPGEASLFPERLRRRATDTTRSSGRYHSQRRPGNRDEFDGPTQLLEMPSPITVETQEEDLPPLPTTLDMQEQEQILCDVNDRLSRCAFDFVAKYQFPIPVESDKKHVNGPQDREWTEWVYLLKRLATKRRIPARVLYNGQIKQFITVLENALETRHVVKNQSRPLKDDRNVLQFISAGTQVAKILKDAPAMEYFDWLYVQTEKYIHERRMHRGKAVFDNAR
ncbi:conserved hypothetical protein [Uncinocarpus reesii 1704]|uniref:Uncharacterized protein n=1 Tax=Uncinocarpus reesii (strain UAMH 1704) TaxID=336963 RepID=C4JF90_UNCRE|nr:uncharacterized protein UREG_02312 [Uncinocarpus reesii 1704]EEP77463.1 conserved hypothetical protein [Uncinocarpus reesii 1704]